MDVVRSLFVFGNSCFLTHPCGVKTHWMRTCSSEKLSRTRMGERVKRYEAIMYRNLFVGAVSPLILPKHKCLGFLGGLS